MPTGQSARLLVGSVRDMWPLLARPSHVELTSFADADRDDLSSRRTSHERLATCLGRHRVQALPILLSQAKPWVGERMLLGGVANVAVVEAPLSHAADMHAGFIVIRGHGHPRLWELVLGGVTRTMLETTTVLVPMSH